MILYPIEDGFVGCNSDYTKKRILLEIQDDSNQYRIRMSIEEIQELIALLDSLLAAIENSINHGERL